MSGVRFGYRLSRRSWVSMPWWLAIPGFLLYVALATIAVVITAVGTLIIVSTVLAFRVGQSVWRESVRGSRAGWHEVEQVRDQRRGLKP